MLIHGLHFTNRHSILEYSLPLIVIFIASVNPELQSTCPERCSCYLNRDPRTIICAKQDLTVFPDDISDSVQYLDLSVNLLEEIPNTVTLLRQLGSLSLARNRLTTLPTNLHNLDKLQKLDLSGNAFTSVSGVASISHLTSLKTLYLAENPITNLEGLTSQTLQALDFSRCELKAFANESLSGVPQLSTLSLAGNPLKLVQKPASEMLMRLDMSDCQINYLNPDSLEYLPNLEELRMANNPTLVFSTRYDTLTHDRLKILDASRCNLDRPGLHGLPQLTQVKLSRNLIRILPDQIFAKNVALQQIYLAANGLDQLDKGAFAGLANLELLDLSSNALRNVHWASFSENINLKLLNLSHNSLLDFPNLTSPTTLLDLSANLIDDFNGNVLLNMSRLKTLNLNYNRIDEIPDQLESLSLVLLSLRQNRIIQLNNRTFDLLPALERLDLSGNRLTEPPQPSVFEKNPFLQRVLMDDNPWRCDCEHIYDIWEFLTEPPAKTSAQTLVCQTPGNVSGFSWQNACEETWEGPNFNSRDKAWGMILISILTMIIVFGSVVSLRHAMKIKRQAHLERQELERAEARERLRLLQRRVRQEEELLEVSSEPRINPLEFVGPPSYEDAVHMPRLAHSMDALDSISMDSVPTHILGSVDNLRSKKRRSRRPRKRAQSDENLARREERREIRRRRASTEKNQSASDLVDSAQSPMDSNTELTSTKTLPYRRPRARSISEDGSSTRGRPRPLTPAVRHKKRRGLARDGHSSDDEDSDAQNGITPNLSKSCSGIVIKNLTREPRGGYRPATQESDF